MRSVVLVLKAPGECTFRSPRSAGVSHVMRTGRILGWWTLNLARGLPNWNLSKRRPGLRWAAELWSYFKGITISCLHRCYTSEMIPWQLYQFDEKILGQFVARVVEPLPKTRNCETSSWWTTCHPLRYKHYVTNSMARTGYTRATQYLMGCSCPSWTKMMRSLWFLRFDSNCRCFLVLVDVGKATVGFAMIKHICQQTYHNQLSSVTITKLIYDYTMITISNHRFNRP